VAGVSGGADGVQQPGAALRALPAVPGQRSGPAAEWGAAGGAAGGAVAPAGAGEGGAGAEARLISEVQRRLLAWDGAGRADLEHSLRVVTRRYFIRRFCRKARAGPPPAPPPSIIVLGGHAAFLTPY